MSGPCVLIAEDDEDIRDALAFAVRAAGYAVAVAGDGEEALAAMREQRPAILVLDLMMPKIDGWQVMYAMEQDAALAAVPVCVVSAVPGHAPPSALCVLSKPIELKRLIATIRGVCGA